MLIIQVTKLAWLNAIKVKISLVQTISRKDYMSLKEIGGPIGGETLLQKRVELRDGKQIQIGFDDNRPDREHKFYRLEEGQEIVTENGRIFIKEDIGSFIARQN